jgi:SOS response regulatory protein OraA/RecX
MAFHMYNQELYSVPQYNADATFYWQQLADSLTATDTISKSLLKTVTETVSLSETIAKTYRMGLLDNVLLAENFTKQVTNKGLFDTVRIASWLTVKRAPGNNPWSD